MSHIVNIHEAKTQLSKLIALSEQGETVIIARNGMPVVQLVPTHSTHKPIFGLGKSQLPDLGPDAFAALTEKEVKDWY
jgi:prevent-host-death family protein